MSEDDEQAAASVAFRPGWPDLLPTGLIVARSSVTQLSPDGDPEIPDDDDVRWVLHAGTRPAAPRFAIFGDLTVTNPFAFAGVTVVMPVILRDEPDVMDDDFVSETLAQYGEWASSFMYDHAAMAMRTALAGNGLPLSVPFETPAAHIHMPVNDDEPSEPTG